MKIRFTIWWISILLLPLKESFAQISITFPMEKAVFQRNINNISNINIAGSYTSPINAVEARLLNTANSPVTDWNNISATIGGGIFNGTIYGVWAGWYVLEVRGLLNGNQVGLATLYRVGVGEVFVIAGQSNSQGLDGDQAEVGANDERVVSHNEISWYNSSSDQCNQQMPNYPSFSQIFSSGGSRSYLSKTGRNPWCYGKLGDNLVNRLGVPIAFFNAGAEGSSSLNWKESSDGLGTLSPFTGGQYCNVVGVPYSGFKKSLNYYASMFGIRAVLWHQGETDNYTNTDESTYINNVTHVINKSRSDFGYTIPWVIAKVSVFNKNANGGNGNPNYAIINAQNSLVNIGNKVFSGPSTDDILGSNRSDEVHFYGGGLIELGNRWDASLNTDFFNNATPISAKPLPIITTNCVSNTTLRLSAPAGFISYKWVSISNGNNDYEDVAESTSQYIDRSAGTYRCYLTDGQGNITFTQPITVQDVASYCYTPPPTCTGLTYISDINPISSSNGFGPIEKDMSNGNSGSNDGTPLKIRGKSYTKGIGAHANSEIIYNLGGVYSRFISEIGIDDEVATAASGATVIFKVYNDNNLVYSSNVLTGTSSPVKININVSGVNTLKLEINDSGDNFYSDHADWADARLHCIDTQAPTAPTTLTKNQPSSNVVNLNWTGSTDNMEVEKYNIYMNGNLIASVDFPITNYQVTGLNLITNYTFYVKAVDYNNNESAQSNSVSVNGSNCASTLTFVQPTDNMAGITQTFNASQTIKASNIISTNAKINYNAGQSVTLLPGFQVTAGTVFVAKIAGCTP